MSSPSGNKRKADDITDKNGPHRPAPPLRRDDRHLPAPIWGHVLDYMPYEEVRSALLVGKIVANEANKYVHALNITKVCQMDGPSTRRFPNIEELNILCMYDFNARSLCKETCQRIVPLTIGFPKLKRLFAGGVYSDGSRQEFGALRASIAVDGQQDENDETFRVLVNHILSAYKMRLLPETIETIGRNFCNEGLEVQPRGEDDAEARSSFCKDVCTYFPLEDVLDSGFPVISGIDIYGIIKRRPGGKQMMQKYSGQYLVDFLNDEVRLYELEGDDPELEGNDPDRAELLLRLSEAGAKRAEHSYHQRPQVQYLMVDALERLDDLIGAGFDPRNISREDLYSRFNIGTERRTFDVFAKDTIDALEALLSMRKI